MEGDESTSCVLRRTRAGSLRANISQNHVRDGRVCSACSVWLLLLLLLHASDEALARLGGGLGCTPAGSGGSSAAADE